MNAEKTQELSQQQATAKEESDKKWESMNQLLLLKEEEITQKAAEIAQKDIQLEECMREKVRAWRNGVQEPSNPWSSVESALRSRGS